jgi:hypothetical protein
MDALARDGYNGYMNLETHWPGPSGDMHEASMICGRILRALVEGWRDRSISKNCTNGEPRRRPFPALGLAEVQERGLLSARVIPSRGNG